MNTLREHNTDPAKGVKDGTAEAIGCYSQAHLYCAEPTDMRFARVACPGRTETPV